MNSVLDFNYPRLAIEIRPARRQSLTRPTTGIERECEERAESGCSRSLQESRNLLLCHSAVFPARLLFVSHLLAAWRLYPDHRISRDFATQQRELKYVSQESVNISDSGFRQAVFDQS